MLQGLALRLKTPAEARRHETAKGKPNRVMGRSGMFFPQPRRGSLGVVDFTLAHVRAAGAGADAAIVEAQGDQTGIARGALQGRDRPY